MVTVPPVGCTKEMTEFFEGIENTCNDVIANRKTIDEGINEIKKTRDKYVNCVSNDNIKNIMKKFANDFISKTIQSINKLKDEFQKLLSAEKAFEGVKAGSTQNSDKRNEFFDKIQKVFTETEIKNLKNDFLNNFKDQNIKKVEEDWADQIIKVFTKNLETFNKNSIAYFQILTVNANKEFEQQHKLIEAYNKVLKELKEVYVESLKNPKNGYEGKINEILEKAKNSVGTSELLKIASLAELMKKNLAFGGATAGASMNEKLDKEIKKYY